MVTDVRTKLVCTVRRRLDAGTIAVRRKTPEFGAEVPVAEPLVVVLLVSGQLLRF